MNRAAVFLDRDGTIIHDGRYIGDPAQVRLLPGAAEGIRRLAEAGFAVVVVSNQSGIARGLFDETALQQVHARLEALLDQNGARLEGAYYCPYLAGPEATKEDFRRDSELRKPRPGMILQAQDELGLDLSRSWMVGNAETDVQAGLAAGCRTVLIRNGAAADASRQAGQGADAAAPDFVAADLIQAAEFITKAAVLDMPYSPENPDRPAAEPSATSPSSSDRVTAGSDAGEVREAVQILRRIHDQVERANRRVRQHDFSVLRLFGTLLQMFAIVVGLWGLLALTGERHDAATARLALACLLQVASLAAFAHDYLR